MNAGGADFISRIYTVIGSVQGETLKKIVMTCLIVGRKPKFKTP